MSKPVVDYFTEEMAQSYDERNRGLAPISDALHFLVRLTLENLPPRSRILCVGAGTGSEILYLSTHFSEWSFVALEPSLSMLNVCRKRVHDAGIANRCDLVHGFVQDLPARADFDAVLSINVAHFIRRDERADFFRRIAAHLRSGGYFVNTEVSFDLESSEFPEMLKNWEKIQRMMGATPESIKSLPEQLREKLTILTPTETEHLLLQSGIDFVIPFYRAFMICGWYGEKKLTKGSMV
jgi:tRNA (cmo5U34)-methyltransferase